MGNESQSYNYKEVRGHAAADFEDRKDYELNNGDRQPLEARKGKETCPPRASRKKHTPEYTLSSAQ